MPAGRKGSQFRAHSREISPAGRIPGRVGISSPNRAARCKCLRTRRFLGYGVATFPVCTKPAGLSRAETRGAIPVLQDRSWRGRLRPRQARRKCEGRRIGLVARHGSTPPPVAAELREAGERVSWPDAHAIDLHAIEAGNMSPRWPSCACRLVSRPDARGAAELREAGEHVARPDRAIGPYAIETAAAEHVSRPDACARWPSGARPARSPRGGQAARARRPRPPARWSSCASTGGQVSQPDARAVSQMTLARRSCARPLDISPSLTPTR